MNLEADDCALPKNVLCAAKTGEVIGTEIVE
jgi:hypothetical protein